MNAFTVRGMPHAYAKEIIAGSQVMWTERAMNATLSGRITCRADGAVFLALIARGWVLVALADGWARMEPKPVQRNAP